MGPGNGRMWASAPTRVTGTRRSGGHTSPPLIPSCRGRRPRRPASSADNRQASASGKRTQGYPGPPRAQGFPKSSAFYQSYYKRVPTFPRRRPEVRACADRPAEAFFLLDRARPVCLRPKCRRSCGGWPTTRACGRSLFGKTEWGPRASPAERVAWGKAEQRERAQFSHRGPRRAPRGGESRSSGVSEFWPQAGTKDTELVTARETE